VEVRPLFGMFKSVKTISL